MNRYVNDFKTSVVTEWDLADKGKHVLNWFGIMRAKLFCALQEQSVKHSANALCCTSSASGMELKCHRQLMIQWSAVLLSQFSIVPL